MNEKSLIFMAGTEMLVRVSWKALESFLRRKVFNIKHPIWAATLAVGTPEMVRERLLEIERRTGADEIIITSQI